MTDWRDVSSRLGRYTFVGVLTLALFIGLSNGLPYLEIVQPGIATGVAIVASGVFNYSFHRLYTFGSVRSVASSLPRYVLLLLTNAFLGSIFVSASISWLKIEPLVANLACAAAITLLSFLVMRSKVM